MVLFDNTRIVEWAEAGEWIPLKCDKCDTLWTTKNLYYIGAKPIHFGYDYDACRKCEKAKHSIRFLKPSQATYRSGKW